MPGGRIDRVIDDAGFIRRECLIKPSGGHGVAWAVRVELEIDAWGSREMHGLHARQGVGPVGRAAARVGDGVDVACTLGDRVVGAAAAIDRDVAGLGMSRRIDEAGAADQRIVSAAAGQRIGARAAVERVVARVADDDIVERVAGDIDVGAVVVDGVVVDQRDVVHAAVGNRAVVSELSRQRQVEIGGIRGRLDIEVVDHDLGADRAGRATLHNDRVACVDIIALATEYVIGRRVEREVERVDRVRDREAVIIASAVVAGRKTQIAAGIDDVRIGRIGIAVMRQNVRDLCRIWQIGGAVVTAAKQERRAVVAERVAADRRRLRRLKQPADAGDLAVDHDSVVTAFAGGVDRRCRWKLLFVICWLAPIPCRRIADAVGDDDAFVEDVVVDRVGRDLVASRSFRCR